MAHSSPISVLLPIDVLFGAQEFSGIERILEQENKKEYEKISPPMVYPLQKSCYSIHKFTIFTR